MTYRHLAGLAALGSAALLIAAFGFQHLGGLAPCKMCLWQRWPHAAAVLIGAAVIATGWRSLAWAGAAAAAASAGIGIYHTGVERGWFEGPTSCTSGPIGGLSPDQLLDQIMAAPLVRCDEVPWEFLTLSMASWNAVASAALAVIWVLAATRR
jgi:disulfide bond formation protein DsbB